MTPDVSVVVVAYDMGRELPRTLVSLSRPYQRRVGAGALEVVVVDNGSPTPVAQDEVDRACPGARLIRLDDAPPSPAQAANVGVDAARGELVGLIVDGARIASPGLVGAAVQASRLAEEPVVATPGWHLGDAAHGTPAAAEHDQEAEDELLDAVGWPAEGYRLFEISCLASSSGRGVFGPMGETSALFLRRATWDRLGGLDEAFDLPGGGLVNHDLYRRACLDPATELIVLLGEGTFHQFHGGAATSGRFGWDDMAAQYVELRGSPYRPPDVPPLYVGRVPPELLEHLGRSVELAIARRDRRARRRGEVSGTA